MPKHTKAEKAKNKRKKKGKPTPMDKAMKGLNK